MQAKKSERQLSILQMDGSIDFKNINYIPKEGQAVKVINYDPEKDIVNREYIAVFISL